MRRRLPPLNTLRIFEAAARHGQLKVAAEELALTPSAVSHAVRALEEHLGLPLFLRGKKGLALTEVGQRYAATVREALCLLQEGTEQLLDASTPRRLAVSVTPFLAARWLLPRLGTLRERHPEITVLLDTLQQQVSFADGEADLAIRMGQGEWPDLQADLLFRERLVPVCAPDQVERLRADPQSATYIHIRTVSEEWQHWCNATGNRLPDGHRTFMVDTLQLAYDAAASGLGIAMGRSPLIDTDLAAGTLVTPWLETAEATTGYWLVTPLRRLQDPVIATFRHWLLQEIHPQ